MPLNNIFSSESLVSKLLVSFCYDSTDELFLLPTASFAFDSVTNCTDLRQPCIPYMNASIHNKIFFLEINKKIFGQAYDSLTTCQTLINTSVMAAQTRNSQNPPNLIVCINHAQI
jgi:hypothetical protein